MPRPLQPWENFPIYPLNRRLVEPQKQTERFGERTNLLALPGIEEFIGRPAGSLVSRCTDYDSLTSNPKFVWK